MRIKQISLQLQIKPSNWIKMTCAFSQQEISINAMPRPKSEPMIYVPIQKPFISIWKKKHLSLLQHI